VADTGIVPPAPTTEIGYAYGNGSGKGFWSTPLDDEDNPELRWPMSVIVYNKMRHDDAQVKSVLRAVTQPVRRTTWRIDRNGARDEVVAHVASDLGLPVKDEDNDGPKQRTRDRFSWAEHLDLALLMLPFGHMYFEQVYRIDEQGRARLRKLAPRMPRTISRIRVAPDGGLEGIEQYSSAGNFGPTAMIPENRLVAYVNEREGANWYGTSMLRQAYKNWLIKNRLMRLNTQVFDRNGMGVPLYTGADGQVDLAPGQKIASSWRSGEASGAAIPFGASMKLVGVEGKLPDVMDFLRYQDEQIARSVLAHFLNLGTQTGSWALGSTFADFFSMSLQTTAEAVAETANQHIVEDLVDVNFGGDEPAPRVVFDEIGSRHDATAEALALLVQNKVITPEPRLEQAVRTNYGLPGIDPEAPPAPTDGGIL